MNTRAVTPAVLFALEDIMAEKKTTKKPTKKKTNTVKYDGQEWEVLHETFDGLLVIRSGNESRVIGLDAVE